MTTHISKATTHSPSEQAYVINPALPVLTNRRSMQAESTTQPHSHPRGQLLWAESGVLRMTCERAVWVVPSTHAVWIPGGVAHQVSSETDAQIRNLFIDPSIQLRTRDAAVVMLQMSNFMREIVRKLTQSDQVLNGARFNRLGMVAMDEIEDLQALELFMPAGSDPRLQRVIKVMVKNPAQNISLAELANMAGASVRTIERLFKAETGLTFRQWRSRFRMMNSLEDIQRGSSTSVVAYELGYKSVSAFISAFKAAFGCTPSQYGRRTEVNNH